ncbi:DUF7673 family protein [Endozoicomonas ascidiicola]|uniref:DUF7673 family protein n=1 Tax=Endozoicomonas ascidiicola TaxID=1698521 RepID=UPI00082A006D|nr:hypothetical protein [Endozoicomonas ascidiicola]
MPNKKNKNTTDLLDKESSEYSKIQSINTLFELALSHNQNSHIAARVILSCFDGESYHLCVRDLGFLSHAEYHAAMTIIRMRVEDGIEPQKLLNDCQKIKKICNRWGDQLNIHTEKTSVHQNFNIQSFTP